MLPAQFQTPPARRSASPAPASTLAAQATRRPHDHVKKLNEYNRETFKSIDLSISLTHLLTHTPTYTLAHSLTHVLTHTLHRCKLIPRLGYCSRHPINHPLTQSSTHPFIQTTIQSLTHSQALTHPPTCRDAGCSQGSRVVLVIRCEVARCNEARQGCSESLRPVGPQRPHQHCPVGDTAQHSTAEPSPGPPAHTRSSKQHSHIAYSNIK